MPVNMDRYPSEWKIISKRIRQREGNRCKFCGVNNGSFGYRLSDGTFVELVTAIEHEVTPCDVAALQLKNPNVKIIRIVLTVAHLGAPRDDGTPGDPHDKLDVRDSNLAALCQRCHLRYDIDEHVINRRNNRAKKKRAAALAAGQNMMFFDDSAIDVATAKGLLRIIDERN